MNLPLGVALGLGCSLAWAIANVYVQRSARELGDLRAMLWAQLVGMAVLFPLGLAWDGRPTRLDGWLLGLTGAASALGYYGLMRAFRQGPLAAITPVVTTWPVVAAIAGVVWLGERPTALQVVGGLLAVGGAAANGALARGGEWTGSRRDAFVWAAASAIGFGLMTAGVARLRPDVGDLTVVPLTWAAQWAILVPILARDPDSTRPPVRWGAVLGMAGFEALGFVSYSFATLHAPVSVVSPPASLSTLLTAAFAALFLGERIGLGRWLLVLTAVGGTLLVVI